MKFVYLKIIILIFSACSDTTTINMRTSVDEEPITETTPTDTVVNEVQTSSDETADATQKEDETPPDDDKENPPPKPAVDVGVFTSLRWDGTVRGYAYDITDPEKTVEIAIHLDDSPTAIQTIAADQPGTRNGVGGSHLFIAKIPAESITRGEATKISIFALIGGEKIELESSPQPPKALFPPVAETFYISDVAPRLNSCEGCHTWTSESAYLSLGDDLPADGGTRTNNIFYSKASGNNHGGGNQCSGVDGLCDSIASWWDMEFGQN